MKTWTVVDTLHKEGGGLWLVSPGRKPWPLTTDEARRIVRQLSASIDDEEERTA